MIPDKYHAFFSRIQGATGLAMYWFAYTLGFEHEDMFAITFAMTTAFLLLPIYGILTLDYKPGEVAIGSFIGLLLILHFLALGNGNGSGNGNGK
mmetsp:Transcript_41902/g.131365  ORF Transcript_41902/g.131365 Transcript_41902/m.131365 type:complete len:94 (-) Transcript_41902:478-759(-)